MKDDIETLRGFITGKHDMEPEALAALERLAARERNRRWNIDEDGADLLICKDDHEKGEKCDYVRYVKAAERDRLQGRVGTLQKATSHAP